MSFLYVIAASEKGPVKLGLSQDPERRVRQLQTGSAQPLRLFHVEEVHDTRVRVAEKALHKMLGHRRMKGEWFDLDVETAIGEVTYIRITEDFSELGKPDFLKS